MVEISLDAVLLSFFCFSHAFECVDAKEYTSFLMNCVPSVGNEMFHWKPRTFASGIYCLARNLKSGGCLTMNGQCGDVRAQSGYCSHGELKSLKPTDRVQCCLHGIRDGIF